MGVCNIRSLLIAAVVLCNCITWTSSRHQYAHNVLRHRSRHRRQGAGLFLTASHILPGGEGSGAWGPWGEVSPCSRTCGGGVASQKRICLEVDSDGRSLCSGGDTKYFSCQTQDCLEGATDFRTEQCSAYDSVPINDVKYQWVPYIKTLYPCELNCKPRGERFYYRKKIAVTDGTRCNDKSFDVCVNGTCQPVGCDMMLGSNAREDKCRECRGNNTNCHTVSGRIDSQDLTKGYNDVFLIPAGATTIVIEEVGPSNNYLALRSKQYQKYYLNGNYHIDFPRSIVIAGALWHYERSDNGMLAPDKLRSLGPTSEPLYLSLLLQDQNVGIEYEYSIPQNQAPPPDQHYGWVFDSFSPCSTSCGGGIQYRNVTCRSREELKEVDDSLCDQGMRPPTNQSCASQPCAAEWIEGPWSPCSKPCGEGGTRSRSVHCQKVISNGYPSLVEDSECVSHLGPKPDLYQECNKNESCPTWFTGPWKPCDKLCGEGKQTRQVVCHQKKKGKVEVFGDSSCGEEKPAVEQSCILHPCEGVDWVVSDWSGCDTCLSKVRTRQLECATLEKQVVNSSFCANHPKPALLEEACDKTKLPACTVQWYATQWNNCSAECGKGVQTRHVFCGLFDGSSVLKVDGSRCENETKYKDFRPCEVPEEKCPAKWFAGPWSECTKECGGGEQYRRVMCLKGSLEATTCNGEIILDNNQACNTGPCDKDETLPLNAETTPIMDDYDEEDCENEDIDIESAEADPEEDDLPDISGRQSAPEEGSGSEMELGSGTEPDFSDTATTENEIIYRTTTEVLLTPIYTNRSTSDSNATTTEELTTTLSSNETSSTDIGSTNTEGTSPTPDTNSTTPDSNTTTTEAFTTTLSSNDSSSTDSGSTKAESTATPLDTNSTTSDSNITTTEAFTTTLSSNDSSSTDSGFTKAESTASPLDTNSTTSDSNATTTEAFTTTLSSNDTSSTDSSSTKAEGTTPTLDTNSTTSESNATTTTDLTTTLSSNDTSSTDSSSTNTEGTTPTLDTNATSEFSATTTEAITTTLSSNDTSSTDSDSTNTEGTTPTLDTNSTTSESSATTTEANTTTLSSTDSGSTKTESTETPIDTNSTTSYVTTTETLETLTSNDTSSTDSGSTKTESTTSTLDTSSTMSESSATITEAITTTLSSNDTSSTDGDSTKAESTASSLDTTGTTSDSNATTTESFTTTLSSNDSSSTDSSSTKAESTATPLDTNSTTSDSNVTTTEAFTTTLSSNDTSSTDSGSTTDESTASTLLMSTTEESSTASNESSTTESSIDFETTVIETGSTEITSTEVSETEETSSSDETTPYDWLSTVETFTKRSRCKLRKKSKCAKTKFGCCPDKRTAAAGPFDLGCDNPTTCKEAKFGCCPDGVSPAQGPDDKECPLPPCQETLYGCCESDGKTPAEGNEQEGCPPPQPKCMSSKFGCCKDNETEAKGPKKKGCTETEAKKGCVGSKHGCCYDNQTDATGPSGEGCPCAATEFGCCPDNVTTARGQQMEGCLMNCNTSAFGCCPDGETPAHGPEQEGCCQLRSFGCCPDNYKAAEGPQLQGCGCQYAHFGCCPDNVTIARGNENEGCGCKYSEHGCCPDRHTEATGPKFEGCGCHTYQFGCCPDGTTIAKGPGLQGCHCSQSQYKCCGDGETAAQGPDMAGCDCAASKYGCCPDGQTEAEGEKFLGCSDVPENRQANCGLEKSRGNCTNYTVTYYYDVTYGGCSRFWYGGCEGNGNRFADQAECEDVCIHPSPKNACNLPKVKGACNEYYLRWYYDSAREQCGQFVYGGCLGNDNNFQTREACQKQCEPTRSEDLCKVPVDRGSCAGNFNRWGFDVSSGRCEQFLWGGCEGNGNRFASEAACVQRCDPPGALKPECTLPQKVGNCTEKLARWSFSESENRCVPFYYTGCNGNENNFVAEQHCTERCPSAFVPDMCALPAVTGTCANYREKWYYDTTVERCRQFYYGGCGGNGNNFNTEMECERRCQQQQATTTTVRPTTGRQLSGQDICFIEKDPGPCNQMEMRWAYDSRAGACAPFQYGGCGGNQNNFQSQEYCQRYCVSVQDLCQLPMSAGPCQDSEMRWFYDARSDSCSQFTYGGCEGNENRFESREQCEQRCRSGPQVTPTPTNNVAIVEPVAPECRSSPVEPCSEPGEVWYYEPQQRECVAHYNQPLGRDCRRTNVYKSQESCERTCGTFKDLEVCRYPLDVGQCQDRLPKFFFNETAQVCQPFTYGGCLGGPNRFSTADECRDTCIPKASRDPCSVPQDSGPCRGYFIKWYFDRQRGRCEQFVFGGCQGSDNRFDTREECEGRCAAPLYPVTPIQEQRVPEDLSPECQTPDSLAPCGDNSTTFYYDSSRGLCLRGEFGRCRYANSYRSEEECERRCGAFRNYADVCHEPLDPGPCRDSIFKYWYNSDTGACTEFAYGGCGGGANRFSSVDECEEFCALAGPAPRCLVPLSTGSPLCGEVHTSRFYYSPDEGECLRFNYAGCDGNENNFNTYLECARVCGVTENNCDSYTAECERLQCSNGVQRAATAEGCQRCVCAPEAQPDCEQYKQDCATKECSFGIERNTAGACEICTCKEHPCANYPCQANERCVLQPYRDPVTQEAGYNPMCRTENNCDSYTAECARLRCSNGVQRAATAEGCQRCVCAPEAQPDCEQSAQECETMRCSFGIERNPAGACEKCTCKDHPCTDFPCQAGDRCVAQPYRDPVTQEAGYSPICRTVRKPGSCPVSAPIVETPECRLECNDDADCWEQDKCCSQGCHQLCLSPSASATTPWYTTPRTTTFMPANNCDSYTAECARLRCSNGVQRAATAEGCQRCVCAPEAQPDCEQSAQECAKQRCPFGIERNFDGACEICTCKAHPCANYPCQAGERCVLQADRDPVTQELLSYDPVCRSMRKRGSCPVSAPSVDGAGCRRECNDDADCQEQAKCCTQGCSQLCLSPSASATTPWYTTPRTTTFVPELQQAPQPNPDTVPEVTGGEQGTATLRCLFHGNPPPKITWQRGQITIDGSVGRYRLLSDGALEIVSLYRNDTGVYICIADNEHGSARQEVRLQVMDPVTQPAGISGEKNARQTGELGQALVLRCLAYGSPTPTVAWYRGNNMVPYSSHQYEARGIYLRIKSLAAETLGEYACQAFNGEGQPASWSVVVQAYRSGSSWLPRDSPYLVDREPAVVRVTPRPPASRPTTSTTLPPPEPEPFNAPVLTRLGITQSTYQSGSDLSIGCDVDGFPTPEVYWTKDGDPLGNSDRMTVSASRLTISRVIPTDSGEYGCHARNAYSSHYALARISVEGQLLPLWCKDNPIFAKCSLIISSKFCRHKFYSQLCCKSCVEAGQMTMAEVESIRQTNPL